MIDQGSIEAQDPSSGKKEFERSITITGGVWNPNTETAEPQNGERIIGVYALPSASNSDGMHNQVLYRVVEDRNSKRTRVIKETSTSQLTATKGTFGETHVKLPDTSEVGFDGHVVTRVVDSPQGKPTTFTDFVYTHRTISLPQIQMLHKQGLH
jgi:hypothetical protein